MRGDLRFVTIFDKGFPSPGGNFLSLTTNSGTIQYFVGECSPSDDDVLFGQLLASCSNKYLMQFNFTEINNNFYDNEVYKEVKVTLKKRKHSMAPFA